MTTTETPEAVEADAPTEEELGQLRDSTLAALEQQPTMRLLDVEAAEWHAMDGPGRHLLTIQPGITGILDVATQRFVPDIPETVAELLAARLTTEIGDAPVAGGRTPHVIDWPTLQITNEADGVLTATASTVPGETGVIYEVTLSMDAEFATQVTADNPIGGDVDAVVAATAETIAETAAAFEAANATADTEAGTAEAQDGADEVIDGDYLGRYYADSEFAFEDKNFVIDWSTWNSDQTTEDGLVGSPATATADGRSYEIYAWFDPEAGIDIVSATALDDGAATDGTDGTDSDEPEHGITGQYLGDYYGSDPQPYDGRNFVVDWATWDPDEVTDDGVVGSFVTGTDDTGRAHRLYIWFDPEDGPEIASAEATATAEDVADAAGDQAADEEDEEDEEDEVLEPDEYFAQVVVEELRDHWRGNNKRLTDSTGKDYDVSAWIDGDRDCEPEFVGFDGKAFTVRMLMSTTGDEPGRVRCRLLVRDAQDVLVEHEERV